MSKTANQDTLQLKSFGEVKEKKRKTIWKEINSNKSTLFEPLPKEKPKILQEKINSEKLNAERNNKVIKGKLI